MTFTIKSVSNLVYASADNTSRIDCIVDTDEYGAIPFTATMFDVMPYGVALYNALISGAYGAIISPYVAP